MMQEVRLALFMIKKKSCRKKNLEVDSSRICPKKANFHIVTGRSDHFGFCDSHLVQNFERLQIILQRLFLDKWKSFSAEQFVLQVESNKWKTKYQENYGVRKLTSATKTPHSNNY